MAPVSALRSKGRFGDLVGIHGRRSLDHGAERLENARIGGGLVRLRALAVIPNADSEVAILVEEGHFLPETALLLEKRDNLVLEKRRKFLFFSVFDLEMNISCKLHGGYSLGPWDEWRLSGPRWKEGNDKVSKPTQPFYIDVFGARTTTTASATPRHGLTAEGSSESSYLLITPG